MWEISQIRETAPSAYEAALCEAVFAIVRREVHDLPGIVKELNESDVRPEAGGEWTEEVFIAEMKRLGDGIEKAPVPDARY